MSQDLIRDNLLASLPPGRLWTPQDDAALLIDAIGEMFGGNYDAAVTLALIRQGLDPDTQSEIAREVGMFPLPDSATGLDSIVAALRLGLHDTGAAAITALIKALGFDVQIHANSPVPINPGVIAGKIIANGDMLAHTIQPALILGNKYAVCGYYGAICGLQQLTVGAVRDHTIGDNWQNIVFVGGNAARSTAGALTSIAPANVPLNRIPELTHYLLRYLPAHIWAVIVTSIWDAADRIDLSSDPIHAAAWDGNPYQHVVIVGPGGFTSFSLWGNSGWHASWTDSSDDWFCAEYLGAYYDNILLIGGKGGQLAWSDDGGASWIRYLAPRTYDCRAIAYKPSGTPQVAICANWGVVYYSASPKLVPTWSVSWLPSLEDCRDIIWTGTSYVIALDGGNIIYGQDIDLWTVHTLGSGNWVGVAKYGDRVIAVADNGDFARSDDDGLTWDLDNIPGKNFVTISNCRDRLVATTTDGDIISTTDGESWSYDSVSWEGHPNGPWVWLDIISTGQRLVAVSQQGDVIASNLLGET